MIIWINGSFGSGKSTVARIIRRRIKDSFIYDPENIGYFFRKNLPGCFNPADFQDEPLWRELNYLLLRRIAENYKGLVIVPMTLVNPAYFSEIIGRLREDGFIINHFVLGASSRTLHRRLRKRLDFKNSWPARQVERCVAAFADPIFETYLDTEKLTAKQAADEIIRKAGL